MKISKIVMMLVMGGVVSTPALTASNTVAFYYVECLQNAAMINAQPNANGAPHDPNSIWDPSNPELYRFCTARAIQEAAGQ